MSRKWQANWQPERPVNQSAWCRSSSSLSVLLFSPTARQTRAASRVSKILESMESNTSFPNIYLLHYQPAIKYAASRDATGSYDATVYVVYTHSLPTLTISWADTHFCALLQTTSQSFDGLICPKWFGLFLFPAP